jgi:hypothetical protein
VPERIVRARANTEGSGPLIPLVERGGAMIIVGVILLIIGFALKIPVLWTVGIVLAVIGVILMALASAGRPVAGRRHWW